MRVTNSSIYTGIYSNTNTQLNNIQDTNLHSNMRILNAADDPSGYQLMSTLEKSISDFDAYSDNMDLASSYSTDVDSSLDSAEDYLNEAMTLVIQASNGTWNQADLDSMADEVDQYLNGLIQVANYESSLGESLYSGSNVDDEPFSLTKDASGEVTGAAYQGDSSGKTIYISSSQDVPVTFDGSDVFSDGNGNSLFDTLISARDQMRAGTFDEATSEALVDSLQGGLDNISSVRSTAGINQNTIDSLSAFNTNMTENYTQLLSNTKDADIAQVTTDLLEYQTALEMATQAGKTLSDVSFIDLG